MTSAQFTTGITDNMKPTSRVLRPPGGGTSNILNPCPEEDTNRQVKNYNRSDIFNQAPEQRPAPAHVVKDYNRSDVLNQAGAGDQQQKPGMGKEKKEGDSDEEDEGNAPKPAPPPPMEAPVRVTAPKQGINPITGMVTGGSQVKTSTKVCQPPGGASTKLW